MYGAVGTKDDPVKSVDEEQRQAPRNAGFLSLPADCTEDAALEAEQDLSSWRRVFSVLARDTAPIAGTLLVIFLSQTVTLAFVGHRLGTRLQAAYGVAVSIFNVTGMSIAIGFLAALDTLCSQAYGRDPTGRGLPVFVHRGILLAFALAVPMVFGFYHCEGLLVRLFGEHIALPAAEFLRAMPVYLLSNSVWEAYQKGLQSHQAQALSMASSVVALVAAPVICDYFIVPERGILGAAAALTATNAVGATTCVALAVFHSKSKLGRLPPPDFDGQTYVSRLLSMPDAIEFVRIGVPAMVLVCAEWWSLEVLLVFVSSMGTVEAAAFASLVNIIVVMWALPTGAAIASSVRIGNSLGANLPHIAETWRRVAFIANGLIASVDASVLVFFIDRLALLYTTDPKVVAMFRHIAPAVAAMHFFDALLTAGQNCFRGAGKQALGAKYCIVSLWAVGVPACFLAASMAPPHERPVAAVIGYTTGFALMIAVSLWDMHRWDWVALAAETAAKSDSVAGDNACAA